MDFAERAARNEEIFRSVNERIEHGALQHGVQTPLPFHCECGSVSCLSTIQITPPEYDRVAQERYRFVLIPGHEDQAIEQIVERHPSFVVVERPARHENRSTATTRSKATATSTPPARHT